MTGITSNFRYLPLLFVALVWLAACIGSTQVSLLAWIVLTGLLALGIWDLFQHKHALFRNYPLFGRLRFLSEEIGPQVRQYFIESDTDGKPFDREQRALVYQRAKNVRDTMPFGTERRVMEPGYEWLSHSIAPSRAPSQLPRIKVGGASCKQPYSASLLNISGMSFGALSGSAIEALNRGAANGHFAQSTGEGGLSPHHMAGQGDIIWQVGTGYFGCRNKDGTFNLEQFTEVATRPQVKMVEIKLSQGAKPGHGGLLPGSKVTSAIASTRGVPAGEDCLSPAFHSEFSTPLQLLEFVKRLRLASGSKPVGIKLCVGHPWEFLAICKAMIETGTVPDFFTVDGAEGGTGAAPVEFSDRVGMPLRDGLAFVNNALIGSGLRNRTKIAASGKILSGFDIALTLSLGADWCNSARAFMLALGCLQSQKCHSNECPVGIATQDPMRERALLVDDKSIRIANFHRHTLKALTDLTAAAGFDSPEELSPTIFSRRLITGANENLTAAFPLLNEGELLTGECASPLWKIHWDQARTDSFKPK